LCVRAEVLRQLGCALSSRRGGCGWQATLSSLLRWRWVLNRLKSLLIWQQRVLGRGWVLGIQGARNGRGTLR